VFPQIYYEPLTKETMKQSEMKRVKRVINYRDQMTQQEYNVDSKIVSTQPTHKVKGVEIIDGVEYYVLSI
jgi:uncharacterized lipoprotein YehR (DUF1307 family)